MSSSTPSSQRSPCDIEALLPAEVLAELRTIYPAPPKDQYADVGRCASTGKPITICYNTFGNPQHPCMLLIMGLNCTATFWDTRLCEYIAQAGFYVIRYDNRDVGLSTNFDGYATPNIFRLALPAWASVGEPPLAYTLDDMANDAAGLLRALCIEKAHIVGCSMGGMIAQLLAVHHPEVVASLCLHSTAAGVPWPEPRVLINMLDGPESTQDVQRVLDYRVRYYKAMAGDMTFHEREVRLGLRWDLARSNYIGGSGRHLAAIIRGGDRSALLQAKLNHSHVHPHTVGAQVTAESTRASIPVAILHGGKDPTIPVMHAQHLSECINGSKLVIYPHMGHYFSKDMFRPLADEMILNARSVAVTE